MIYGNPLGSPAQSVQIPALVRQAKVSGVAPYIGRGLFALSPRRASITALATASERRMSSTPTSSSAVAGSLRGFRFRRLRSSCAPSISLTLCFQRVDLRAEIIDTRAQRSYIGIDLGHQSFKFTFELFVDAKAQFADRITEGFDLILGKNTVVVSDFIGQASGV